jgi:ligand-binding sensor domain-containing protein
LLISIFNFTYAQEPLNIKFDRISSENIKFEKGLSQNLVFSILQDKDGFMWFGTWDGLNRYDGYDFRIYNKHNGLSNTTIRSLMEDDENQIWVGTEDGLNLLDPHTGNILTLKHDPDISNSLSDNFINHIYQDEDGYIWICTSRGLNRYDKTNKVFSRYYFYSEEADSIQSNWINKVHQDNNGDLWIATRFGLFRFDLSSLVFEPCFHLSQDPHTISSNNILSIYQDRFGYLWTGTANGLNRYDFKTNRFKRFFHDPKETTSLSHNIVNAIYEDSLGYLWIGTRDKLNLFNRENESFYHFRPTSEKTSLSNEDIRSIYEDKTNNLWVGTFKGVNKIDRSSSKFTHYEKSIDNPNTLSNNIIYSIMKDNDGLIWIVTAKGLNILDRKTGNYQLIDYQIDDLNNLSNAKIRNVIRDRNGIYWIGTEYFGLLRYDRDKGKFTRFYHDPSNPASINNNGILCITEGSDGKLWIGTAGGLNIFDPGNNTFIPYVHNPKDPQSLSNNRIWEIYEDRHENIWLGTNGGLNRFVKETGTFIRHTYDPDDPYSISSDKIFSIYEDRDGIYWIGTMGGGLNRYDPSTNRFTAFTVEDGLPNNVVYATLEDDEGNFWLPTNWGLSKFNRRDTTFINYDVKDGLQGNEFNGAANFISPDGEMFIGGMNGFNAFYPGEIKQNKNIPKIVITTFKKFNQAQPTQINNGDTIFLNYNDNFVSFEFSALDFTNPPKNKYKFKLDHYDMDWISRDANRRIAEYANVSPGSYTFHVTGSNNDGIWNDKGLSLTLIITPPWWATLVFRISFGLFILTTLWYIIYRQIKNIKAKHEIAKKMLDFEKHLFDVEQKALRLQMNPHFIFNSLNAIQSFVIANDTDKAIHYLAKFSRLMRLILSNSRKSYIPIEDELKALSYFMDIEKLRFDDKFDYTIHVDPKIDNEFMAIPPMIIQPFVENAILHGLIHSSEKGHLQIDFILKEDTIFCSIEDNGIGRAKALKIRETSGIKRKSRGMIITKERIDLLNKQNKDKYSIRVIDLKDDQGNAKGTRVEIKMFYQEL